MSFFRNPGQSSIFTKILFLFFAVFTIFISCYAFLTKNPVFLLAGVLPSASISGILFCRSFLPGISERISYSIFFPRSFLGKAPLVLSPYFGMLTSERYEELYHAVRPLMAEHSNDPDVIFLYANACMNLARQDEAFSSMERFFSLKRRAGGAHAKILFYYADKAVEYSRMQELSGILQKEIRKGCYTGSEKNAIAIRMETLQRRLNREDQ